MVCQPARLSIPVRLLILSASARFIASSSVRAGFSFSAVDLFGDWDLQQLCGGSRESENKCRQVASFQEFSDLADDCCDAVVLGGGLENQTELLGQISRKARLLGTSPAQLSRLINPDCFRVLAAAIQSVGGMVPRIKSSITARDDLSQWLYKKTAGAGGQHVRFASINDIDLPENDDHLFQQYIEGELVSAIFVAVDGASRNCRLLGLSRQLVGEAKLGASQFAYCGSIGLDDSAKYDCETIERIGQTISSEFQIVGVFGIDLILNSNGAWPVDINPRIPASAEIFELDRLLSTKGPRQRESSPSIVAIHLAACDGKSTSSMWECKNEIGFNSNRLGKAILYWRQQESVVFDQTRLSFVTGKYWDTASGDVPPSRWVADVPCTGRVIRHGDPVLSLFVRGATEKLVYERLLSFASELEIGLATKIV